MTIERVRDAIWQAINPDGGPSPAMAPLVELYARAARAAMQAAAAPEAPEAPSDAGEQLHAVAERICRDVYGPVEANWPNGLCNSISMELMNAYRAAQRPDGRTGGK
jgi:hypothetical protein